MDYSPPEFDSPQFNTSLFLTDGGGFLTLADGDARYLRLAGGTVRGYTVFGASLNVLGTLSINSSVVSLDVISGVTPGDAMASKALILDSDKEISLLNAISSNTYNGTTANIQFMNNDINTSAINCNAPMFYALATNNTAANQTYQQWSNTLGTPITVEMDINNASPMFGTTSNHLLRLMTNNTERMRINSGGNISIGNTNNTYKLDVTGATASSSFRLRGPAVDFVMDAITGVGSSDAGLRIYAASQGLLTYSNMSFFDPTATTNILSISTRNQTCVHARVASSADTGIALGNTGFVSGFNAIFRDAVMITQNSLTNSSNYTPGAKLTITASTAYAAGSLNKALIIQNSNFVNKFSIDIGNANYDPLWMGTTTASDVYIGAGNTTALTISNSTRYINIGSEDLGRVPLDIRSTANYTFNPSALFTAYRLRTDSGVTESSTSAVTYTVSALFQGYIGCTAMAMTSDVRLKQDIKPVPMDRIKALYELDVVEYNWKSKPDGLSEVGLIAQSVAKTGLFDLISTHPNDKIEGGADPVLEPAGVQFNVDYSRLSVYNMRMIQSLIEKIDLLELKLKMLE